MREPARAPTGDGFVLGEIGDDRFPPRPVRIHLPAGYDESDGPYPVMYLHDGQNAFDAGSSADRVMWGADAAADELAAEGLPTIIVAIDHGPDRAAEYSPWLEPRFSAGGDGAAYVEFVRSRIKALVEADLPVRRDPDGVATGGSSLGALIALFSVLKHPDEFGFCAALSPAIWWGSAAIVDVARERDRSGLRCYLDLGTRESPDAARMRIGLESVERMGAVLREQNADTVLVLDSDAPHHESAWRRRFPAALAWFLDPARRPMNP